MSGEEAAALAALNPILRQLLAEVKAIRLDVKSMLDELTEKEADK